MSESPRTRSRMLSLALPFAVLGLAAGCLSDGLLAVIPSLNIERKNPIVAALCGALMGAVLGAVLSHNLDARDRFIATLQRTALMVAGGIVAGGTVAGLHGSPGDVMWGWGVLGGALYGGVSALAFVPIGSLLITLVARTELAPQRRLWTGVDRRAMWSILTTVIAVSTLAIALDGPLASRPKAGLLSWFGMMMTIAAGLVLIAILFADAFAFFRVDGLAVTDLRQVRAAFVQALLRSTIGLSVTAAVLVGHCYLETPTALLGVLDARCRRTVSACTGIIDFSGACRRARNACYQAGVLLQPAAVPVNCPAPPHFDRPPPPDIQRGEALLRAGGDVGDRCSCEALERSYGSRSNDETRPQLPDGCLLR
jgi:MFS family permease